MDLSKSSDALLNEYKGNLYEFLVASELAAICGLHGDFFESLPVDFTQMLTQQESFIRKFYPNLLIDLPILGKSLARSIFDEINSIVTSISLVGKVAASSKDIGEADIIVHTEIQKYYISVKLSKEHSYVNTKSAGIKSFISKYFSSFKGATADQDKLSLFFDSEFEKFSRKVHELHDIDYDDVFTSWTLEALPRLPGALKDESRQAYLGFAYNVNNFIYNIIKKYSENQSAFVSSIYPLIGQSNAEILQACTYYKGTGEKLTFSGQIYNFNQSDVEGDISVNNNKKSTSFEILIGGVSVQIRFKCMNKFTSKSFKVNCAVKHL